MDLIQAADLRTRMRAHTHVRVRFCGRANAHNQVVEKANFKMATRKCFSNKPAITSDTAKKQKKRKEKKTLGLIIPARGWKIT
jgi:hypothetical protein